MDINLGDHNMVRSNFQTRTNAGGISILKKLISDKSAAYSSGPAFTFLVLVCSLVGGAFVWIILSPLFGSLNMLAISLFTGSSAGYYSETVTDAVRYVFMFISYSVVVFVLFVIGNFLKKYLQPWTME